MPQVSESRRKAGDGIEAPESFAPEQPAQRPWLLFDSPGRVWWWLAGALAAGLVFGLGSLRLLELLARPLAYLILAITIAASLAPVVGWLESRMSRKVAVVLVYLAILLLFAGFILLLTPSLASQLERMGESLPGLIQQAQGIVDQWTRGIGLGSFSNMLTSQMGTLSENFLRLPLTISSGVVNFLLVLFVSFYMLMEAPVIQKFLLSLFPSDEKEKAEETMEKMAQAMGGYLRGSAITGVVVGIATTIGLLVMGIDFAFVLGALAAILELVPIVGPIVASGVILLVALASSPDRVWIVLIFLVVLQQVENNLLVPNIMHSQTRVSSLLVLVALFVGQAVAGLLGALVAIPLAAALRVFVREVVAPAIRQASGAE